MNKNNKLTDTDPCPFGNKFRGIPMQDVPVSYLHWVWENCKSGGEPLNQIRGYIFENLDALKQEDTDRIWSKP